MPFGTVRALFGSIWTSSNGPGRGTRGRLELGSFSTKHLGVIWRRLAVTWGRVDVFLVALRALSGGWERLGLNCERRTIASELLGVI